MAKILVVDDDPSIVEMLKFLLRKEGHELLLAGDGKTGLSMALEDHPDLVILDVMLPGMDGFMVSGSLFKDPTMRQTPVLILTARENSRHILELVPNVRIYMDKPFEPEELLKNVRQLLSTTN